MTKKELFIYSNRKNEMKFYKYKCIVCNEYPENFIEINGNQENFYMCEKCFCEGDK